MLELVKEFFRSDFFRDFFGGLLIISSVWIAAGTILFNWKHNRVKLILFLGIVALWAGYLLT